jgi:hypothetical protein
MIAIFDYPDIAGKILRFFSQIANSCPKLSKKERFILKNHLYHHF